MQGKQIVARVILALTAVLLVFVLFLLWAVLTNGAGLLALAGVGLALIAVLASMASAIHLDRRVRRTPS